MSRPDTDHTKYRCPTCGFSGELVQIRPTRLRRCKNGHEWVDTARKYPLGYVPLTVRLEQARNDLGEVVGLLQEADTMVRDLSNYLSPKQQQKEGIPGLLYRLEQAKVKHRT